MTRAAGSRISDTRVRWVPVARTTLGVEVECRIGVDGGDEGRAVVAASRTARDGRKKQSRAADTLSRGITASRTPPPALGAGQAELHASGRDSLLRRLAPVHGQVKHGPLDDAVARSYHGRPDAATAARAPASIP